MDKLISRVNGLKNLPIKEVIDSRVAEFETLGKKDSREVWKELCFCFMTANYSAEGGMRIQKEVGDGFISLDNEMLALKLKSLGHRFPNARAGFVVGAREYVDSIKDILGGMESDFERREWLVKNIRGLGMKEASHFLRNIGYKDVAIIDFHIVDLLVKEGLIERPKTLTPKKYVEIENVLKDISFNVGINLGELDLYLWYLETGKVLK